MDSVSGTVRIAASYHRGMLDLIVQHGIWSGTARSVGVLDRTSMWPGS